MARRKKVAKPGPASTGARHFDRCRCIACLRDVVKKEVNPFDPWGWNRFVNRGQVNFNHDIPQFVKSTDIPETIEIDGKTHARVADAARRATTEIKCFYLKILERGLKTLEFEEL